MDICGQRQCARAKLAKEPRTVEELKEEVREYHFTTVALC